MLKELPDTGRGKGCQNVKGATRHKVSKGLPDGKKGYQTQSVEGLPDNKRATGHPEQGKSYQKVQGATRQGATKGPQEEARGGIQKERGYQTQD
jgi:hypothetical protein